jgi:hypothetical protein
MSVSKNVAVTRFYRVLRNGKIFLDVQAKYSTALKAIKINCL